MRICLKFSLKCVKSHKNSEIVDSLMLTTTCLFPIGRVGTYRQVLHLFIKTVCRKQKTKYMYIATNNRRRKLKNGGGGAQIYLYMTHTDLTYSGVSIKVGGLEPP